jgi:hypothetical protein
MGIVDPRITVTARPDGVVVTGAAPDDVRLGLDLVAGLKRQSGGGVPHVRDWLVGVLSQHHGLAIASDEVAAAEDLAEHRLDLVRSGCLTYGELAKRRATSETAARSWVSRHRGQLLVVSSGGRSVVPSFQLTEHGELRPRVAEINAILKDDDTMDDWSRWAWWHSRTSFLSGASPIDVVKENVTRVRTAARRMTARPAA